MDDVYDSLFQGRKDITNEELNILLKTSIINSISAQLEFHTLIVGDPYFYKVINWFF